MNFNNQLSKTHLTIDDYIIEGMEDIFVPLKDIILDKDNIRCHYTLKELLPLARSMVKPGQFQLSLSEFYDDKFKYVFGHRRYWSIKLAENKGWLKDGKVRLTAVNKLPADLRLKIQAQENDLKLSLPSYHLADELWNRYTFELLNYCGSEQMRNSVLKAENMDDINPYLKQKFSVQAFAEMLGRDPGAVRRAVISYQKLHQNIKQDVVEGRQKYSIVTKLGSVPNKNDQIIIYSNAKKKQEKDKKNITTSILSEEIETHFDYLKQISDFEGSFKKSAESKPKKVFKSKTLKDFSSLVDRAHHYLKVIGNIYIYNPEILEITSGVNGDKTSSKEVLQNTDEQLKEYQTKFLENQLYFRRWKGKSKAKTVDEFVSESKVTLDEVLENVMQHAYFKWVDPKDIIHHPNNPRGDPKGFEKLKQKLLTDSIDDVGLLQNFLLLECGNEKYYSLEGNRRKSSTTEINLKRARALVIPKSCDLSMIEQVGIMCDADLFERVNIHDRARGIVRLYNLEKKKFGKDYSINDFQNNNTCWNRKVIEDSLVYDSLNERVKDLYIAGIITYSNSLMLAGLEDQVKQVELAETSAILGYNTKKINEKINEDKNYLFSEEEMDKIAKEGKTSFLVDELQKTFFGISKYLDHFKPNDNKVFLQDYGLTKKFQSFLKELKEINDNHMNYSSPK